MKAITEAGDGLAIVEDHTAGPAITCGLERGEDLGCALHLVQGRVVRQARKDTFG